MQTGRRWIRSGVSFRKNGQIIHNPDGSVIENLDALPWVTKVYQRDLDIRRYNVPFLLHPYVSLYTSRGCPALCSFCLWPQTLSGHRWRLRSSDDVAAEVRHALGAFPEIKEIFFDDDTFNYRKARTLDLCASSSLSTSLGRAPRGLPQITKRSRRCGKRVAVC